MSKENLREALEWDKKGDWEKAHVLAQSEESKEAYWLHAYLHRKEGDQGNAAYWYARAEQPVPDDSLEEEWDRLYQAFQ